jgi:hypothetical protein
MDAVNPVTSLAIDLISGFIVVGADRMIRVFDAATGKLVQTNAGHTSSIGCIAYSSLTHEVP